MPLTWSRDDGNWTAIPNELSRDPDLSHGAKMTWIILKGYDWKDEGAFASRQKVADLVGQSIGQTRRYLQELVKAGWLEIEATEGEANIYTLQVPRLVSEPGTRLASEPPTNKEKTPGKEKTAGGQAASGSPDTTDPEILAAARRLFDLWHDLMGKDGKTRYTDARRKKLVTRLGSYPEEDIATAIRRVAGSKWHRDNGHTELVMIVGSDERLEKYRDMPERPGDTRTFKMERRTKPEDAPW